MRFAVLVALSVAAAGCDAVSHADSLPPDPEVVTADLVLAVEAAADASPEEAASAWVGAHRLFQRDLEPALRHRCGRRLTTELEFSFGRLRVAVDAGTDTHEVARLIRRQLGTALSCVALPEEG